VPDSLPLAADRAFISMIMQNLLDNAVKYTIAGGCICIRARTTNGSVEVTVENNGEPIPPERRPHIFDRFHRAGSDGKTSGHGLGLSIARELAAAHGGELVLVRSDTEWTEFRLRLPRNL
jgi:two-component system sensor histidine kinase TctE